MEIKTDANSFLQLPADFKATNEEDLKLMNFFNETGKEWSDISSGDIKGFSKE